MAKQGNKQVKLTLVRSTSGHIEQHKACVRGLGLRRISHSVVVEDTPCNRGMINKQEFKTACSQIRNDVPSKEWIDETSSDNNGSCCGVYGTSIRLKIIGSDYSECKVLADLC